MAVVFTKGIITPFVKNITQTIEKTSDFKSEILWVNTEKSEAK